MTLVDFLRAVDRDDVSMLDRALAALWWIGRDDTSSGAEASEIASAIEASGHARQNVTRLASALRSDRRVVRATDGGWRLHPRTRTELDGRFASVLDRRQPPTASDTVLPRELFANTRGYIEKVAYQLNASYDLTLYDCTAVMCRRLLETLIVEVYEHAGRAAAAKNADGTFMMFSGLLALIEADSAFNLGRNAVKGLRDFKTLGDLSAHNRRYNARKDDIDRVRDGLRVAAEELLHLAGLAS